VNARDYLDSGIAALGLTGATPDLTQARTAFRRATEIDPSMCDAWMGLAATGDTSVTTLRNAHHTSATLHRETRRIGLADDDLRPVVASPGGYIALYPTSPVSLALAHVVALTAAGDYDDAEKALDDIEITREPAHEAIHKFVGATLHFVTHRWPDVLAGCLRVATLGVRQGEGTRAGSELLGGGRSESVNEGAVVGELGVQHFEAPFGAPVQDAIPR